jgi:hypothetical protein
VRYPIICKICGETTWIGGSYDPSVNALELNDRDRNWDEVCDHIKAGGDYEIGEGEVDDPD